MTPKVFLGLLIRHAIAKGTIKTKEQYNEAMLAQLNRFKMFAGNIK